MSKNNPNAWWDSAYKGNELIEAEFNVTIGKDELVPGVLIRFKNTRGTFKYRCVAWNVKTGKKWIDCLDTKQGSCRSFYIEKFKGVVKSRKPRKPRQKRKAK